MRLPRDLLLLVSFPLFLGMLTLVYLDEHSRAGGDPIPDLAALVFSAHVEPLSVKSIRVVLPGRQDAPQRVGAWRRQIRYLPDDTARVITTIETIKLDISPEYLEQLRNAIQPLLSGRPIRDDLQTRSRLTLREITDVSREQGLLASKFEIMLAGLTVTVNQRPRGEGKVSLELNVLGNPISIELDHELSLAKIGFQPHPNLELGREWDVVVVNLTDLTAAKMSHGGKSHGGQLMRSVRVRVIGLESIQYGEGKVDAFEVRGVESSRVVAYYARDGRVLREQGVVALREMSLVFEREPAGGSQPKER